MTTLSHCPIISLYGGRRVTDVHRVNLTALIGNGRGFFIGGGKMEITLGDKIKINGEEVPEYLLKALYENLKEKFIGYTSISALATDTHRQALSGIAMNSSYEVNAHVSKRPLL